MPSNKLSLDDLVAIRARAMENREAAKGDLKFLHDDPVCGKQRHPTERHAREAIDRVRHAHAEAEDTLRLRPYACRRCGGWHLTTRPQ